MFFDQKAQLILGFFLLLILPVYGQNQRIADSLESIYKNGIKNDKNELALLLDITENQVNAAKKLEYASLLLMRAKDSDSLIYTHSGLLQKAMALRMKSDLALSLENYFLAAKVAIDNDLDIDLGHVYVNIADVYSINGNHNNAVDYYQKSIGIFRQSNDSLKLASALLNLGDEYFNYENMDSALLYGREAGLIFGNIKYPMGEAYSMGNVGMIFAKKGNDSEAELNINKAIEILEKYEDYYPICVYLIYMSDIYLTKGDITKAFGFAHRSLELSKMYGLKDQISAASLKLSELHEKVGDPVQSLVYYKDYVKYRDSVSNVKSVQQMADLRTNYEVSQKQIEVDLLNQEKKTQRVIVISTVAALLLIILFVVLLYRRYKFIQVTNKIIETERNRSDRLLLNILPEETATELKQNGKVQAKKFDSVSVLFTDFKGFTHFSATLTPEMLVQSVDHYFSKFDEIMEKYGLEKIKTVGDAYMCAGGLPFPTNDHAHKIVHAALEIAEFVKKTKEDSSHEIATFDIRIGINTGPVIAGVVGSKKFAYDIWGDTVNIASRMESNSEPGKINISENTYNLVRDSFTCLYRGEISVKNRGMLKMFFVNGSIGLNSLSTTPADESIIH